MTLRRVLLLLLALGLAASLAFAVYVRILQGSGLPLRDGEARLAGLEAPVEVRWDRWGVPHLAGRSAVDLAAAVGYLHANDRFTQMELGRRVAAGRLAEILGEGALQIDRSFRALRLRRAAEEDLAVLSEESRAQLEAYARGVDAWLTARRRDLPPGLRLLGVEPEPWSVVDSLSFVYLLAHDLSFWAGRPEEPRFQFLRQFGPELTRELLDDPEVHLPEELLARLESATEWWREALETVQGPPGSNNWALAGRRTASGVPLVANDPHLPLNLPAIWYQVALRAPDLEVAGMTVPGLPGVVIGRSRHLAWALTHSMLDDHDLFFEEVDEAGERVRRGEEWMPIEAEEETIRVRGGEEETIRVLATDHGPLLPPDPGRRLPPRSLAWTVLEPSDALAAFGALARSTSFEGLLDAISPYVAPAQNLVVAHRDGGVLVTLLGRIPERRRGDGRLPSPGWDPRYGWEGLRPAAGNPVLLNPTEGLAVTANHDVWGPDHERRFAADFDSPHRARRAAALLAAREDWRADEMAGLQTDRVSLYALEVVELLDAPFNGLAGRAHRELAAWDGEMAGTGASALFTLVERELGRALLGEVSERYEIPGMFRRQLLLRLLRGELSEEWLRQVAGLEPDGLAERQAEALERAWRAGRDRWGEGVSQWSFEQLHRLRLEHALNGLPLVGRWYRGFDLSVGGSATTLNAFGGPWQGDHVRIAYGPSMRWVADLADGDRSLAVLPGGQSGHPRDPHYADQLDLWSRGEMRPVLWSEEAVAAGTVSRLTLTPDPPGDRRR